MVSTASARAPVRAASATVVVPSLVGLKLGVAERRLRAKGLSTGWPPDAHRYEPATRAEAFRNHALFVPGSGAELRVTGQDVSPGQRVAVGTTVGLTTVRAPGSPQVALAATPLGFVLARDGRTLTLRFRDEGGRCRPLDDVEVLPRAHWIVVQALVVEADVPSCRDASRSVRLVLPSRVAGRPILTLEPTLPQAGLIAPAPAPAPWSGGYLTPDHRTAVVTFLYGACTKLAGISATVIGGVAHVTLYEGGTQSPVAYPIQPYFVCIAIAYFGETFVRLPRRARLLAGAGPGLPLIRPRRLRARALK